jgi:hypothetical protein
MFANAIHGSLTKIQHKVFSKQLKVMLLAPGGLIKMNLIISNFVEGGRTP